MLWVGAAAALGFEAERVLPVLKRVAVRAPHNTQILQALARACETMGDKAEARAYYNRIILVSVFPEERLWAQKQADSERLRSD